MIDVRHFETTIEHKQTTVESFLVSFLGSMEMKWNRDESF